MLHLWVGGEECTVLCFLYTKCSESVTQGRNLKPESEAHFFSESEAHFAPSPHNCTIFNLQNRKMAKISEILSVKNTIILKLWIISNYSVIGSQ